MGTYKTIDYTIKHGRVIFTLESKRLFGLLRSQFQVTTDTTGYKHCMGRTVVLSWPECKTYAYINPVCTFVNQELTRLQIQGEIREGKSYHYHDTDDAHNRTNS
jgi:hypothetical protein